MERFTCSLLLARRLFAGVVITFFSILSLAPTTAAAAATYKSIRLFGADYVDVQDFGRRHSLTSSWIEPQKAMRLKNSTTLFEITVHSVDASLNGFKIFLARPVVLRAGKLYISEGDAEEFLGPILSGNATESRTPVKTIVIDAGHGGNDPGNQNGRLKLSEKTFTLDVARRLERLLKAQGFKTVMTRKSDRAVDLDRRAEIANKAHADLFISIHFNAFSRASIIGTETYVMTPRNQLSSPQPERDEQMVRTNYPGNEHDRWNALFGYQVHRALVSRLGSLDRGLKRFRYSVLRSVDCPAVLVEAGFLSNDAEGKKVSSPAYRQRIAEAIAQGVQQHATVRQRVKPKKG